MSDKPFRPAWSSQFSSDAIRELHALGPIGELTREWAWGSSSGKGVRVAIIDSGIEKKHPALEKSVQGGVLNGTLKSRIRCATSRTMILSISRGMGPLVRASFTKSLPTPNYSVSACLGET